MPRKSKAGPEAQTALPSIPKELIDQFVKGPMTAEAVHAASAAFKKALIERALGAELGHHLAYAAGEARPEEATNHFRRALELCPRLHALEHLQSDLDVRLADGSRLDLVRVE